MHTRASLGFSKILCCLWAHRSSCGKDYSNPKALERDVTTELSLHSDNQTRRTLDQRAVMLMLCFQEAVCPYMPGSAYILLPARVGRQLHKRLI